MFSSIIVESCSVKTFKVNEDYENWLRLVGLIDSGSRILCYEILHTKENIPDDGAELYCRLLKYKERLHYEIYEEVLCPSNKIIDESKFDLLVYMTVIYYICGVTYQEILQKVSHQRNKIFQMEDVSVCTKDFQRLWNEACAVLCIPGIDIKLPNMLKTCDLFSVEEYEGILDFLEVPKYTSNMQTFQNRLVSEN